MGIYESPNKVTAPIWVWDW